MPPDVVQVFDSYPARARARLRALRSTIFDVAADIDGVGPLEEALRWGEPAYLTTESRSGTTIRIGWKAARPDDYSLYVNCRTTLVDTWSTLFPDLPCVGDRELRFPLRSSPPPCLPECIALALTYRKPKLLAGRIAGSGVRAPIG